MTAEGVCAEVVAGGVPFVFMVVELMAVSPVWVGHGCAQGCAVVVVRPGVGCSGFWIDFVRFCELNAE